MPERSIELLKLLLSDSVLQGFGIAMYAPVNPFVAISHLVFSGIASIALAIDHLLECMSSCYPLPCIHSRLVPGALQVRGARRGSVVVIGDGDTIEVEVRSTNFGIVRLVAVTSTAASISFHVRLRLRPTSGLDRTGTVEDRAEFGHTTSRTASSSEADADHTYRSNVMPSRPGVT
jgi:hypothetical protein